MRNLSLPIAAAACLPGKAANKRDITLIGSMSLPTRAEVLDCVTAVNRLPGYRRVGVQARLPGSRR